MAPKQQTRVAVLGLGYIGLPTAAIVARSGAQVLGIDIHQNVVDTVNSGGVHIEEVDLDALVQGVVARGLLRASTAIEASEVFLIAVPDAVRRRPCSRYPPCADRRAQHRSGAEGGRPDRP